MRLARLLLAGLFACASSPPLLYAQAVVTDTTYTVSADQGSTAGLYPHYFTLTRGDATMGIVVQGGANAGSCANEWCAIVPETQANSWAQSGGTFRSFSDAARQVVAVWNVGHPAPSQPAPVARDSSYTTTRVACPPHGSITCYVVRQHGAVVGAVRQDSTERTYKWIASRPDGAVLVPGERTLTAAATRLALLGPPTTDSTPVVFGRDTVVVTRVVHDTVVVTRVVHDTVTITRVVRDTVYLPAPVDTAASATRMPELPRHMDEMDAMLREASAADTVTRQIFDLVGKSLVARLDADGAPLCSKLVKTTNAAGERVEQPTTFRCPQAVVDAVRAQRGLPR